MEESKYQIDVGKFFTYGTGNAVVNAKAGSGKTTVLKSLFSKLDHNDTALFLAFNVSIVNELKEKLPLRKRSIISTVHSLGMSSIRRIYPSVTVDQDKYIKIMTKEFTNEYFDDLMIEGEDKKRYMSNIKSLISLIRLSLSSAGEGDRAVASKYAIKVVRNEVSEARRIVNKGSSDISSVDFTDMIYLPIVMNLDLRKFMYVFVDEAQDQNACQREIMMRSVHPNGGRFIAVGDPFQSIYGFSGSDSDAFNILKSSKNTKELPLSVCYRCAKNIITEAQAIVPDIEPFDLADDGEIIQNGNIDDVKSGDMIICRKSAPLMSLAMEFIQNQKKVRFFGKDIASGLVDSVRATGAGTPIGAVRRMNADATAYKLSLIRSGYSDMDASIDPEYSAMIDKVMVISAICTRVKSLDEFKSFVYDLFDDSDDDAIIFSTIHKSKGLEADRVWILNKNLIPAPSAVLEWQIAQEWNLLYVAITRAKSTLGYLEYHKEPDLSLLGGDADATVSEFVGNVGEQIVKRVSVSDRREINTKDGRKFIKHIYVDDDGNIISKLTSPESFLSAYKIGSMVDVHGTVSKHSEFRGIKETMLSQIRLKKIKE